MSFAAAFAIVVGEEGGFDADPADPGNYAPDGTLQGTRWGISARAYPDLLGRLPVGVRGTMPASVADLTLLQARAIYHACEWATIRGDALPAPVALLAFDAAVNQGEGRAARWLQLAAGVTVDGIIGPATLAAVAAAEPVDLVAAIGWERDCAYHAAPGWMRYGHGWITRLLRVAALSGTYGADAAPVHLPHPGGRV